MKNVNNLQHVIKDDEDVIFKLDGETVTVGSGLAKICAMERCETVEQAMQCMKINKLIRGAGGDAAEIEDADYTLLKKVADAAGRLFPACVHAQFQLAFTEPSKPAE